MRRVSYGKIGLKTVAACNTGPPIKDAVDYGVGRGKCSPIWCWKRKVFNDMMLEEVSVHRYGAGRCKCSPIWCWKM